MKLTAYRISDPYAIVPAPRRRPAFDAMPDGFANRCLPLLIANQAGWWVLNPRRFSAVWFGDDSIESLVVRGDDPAGVSHFGSGILTFNLPWLFRTDKGWNLQVRGPANWPMDGMYPLEGIVETDWAPMTFTMNWQLQPERLVTFEEGEPFCQLVPTRRGDLEAVVPVETPLAENEPLQAKYTAWAEAREAFNVGLEARDPAIAKQGWQKHYMRGEGATEHQTKLKLREFEGLEIDVTNPHVVHELSTQD